ncbi:hypothetical protein PHMEG_0009922 [Phytophthora megakarya]|uniref:RxLR effector protein n=1 Tax=Phytophthora megakarya TaxID=4795 RepID=A0A225WEZ8_9STRA|nr:hypothetical protein PHMEG_0009922 [Phytophthora megakarya]
MRAQLAVLLALAAVLSGGVSTTAMTKASVMVHRNDAPTKQLLRSDATSRITDDDYGEERNGLVEGMTKIFQQSFSLTRKFKNVEVNKLKLEDVEKLFTSEKYQGWVSDIIRWNDNKNRYTSSLNVNTLFNEELGPEKAFKVFNIASRSANPAVKRKGDRFQLQLLRQLDKDLEVMKQQPNCLTLVYGALTHTTYIFQRGSHTRCLKSGQHKEEPKGR